MAIKSVPIDNGASANDIQVVAAPGAGRVVRVLNIVLIAGGSVTVKFASGTAGGGGQTDLTGAMPLTSTNSLQPGWTDDGFGGRSCHFETKSNEGLVLKFGGAIQVSGYVNYWVGPES